MFSLPILSIPLIGAIGVAAVLGLLGLVYLLIRLFVRPNFCPHCGKAISQW